MTNWINFNHLTEAATKSTTKQGYWWHCFMSLKEAWFLFIVMLGSIVHAFFPFLLDFKLLEMRINRLKVLKQTLPEDELLKKIHFD